MKDEDFEKAVDEQLPPGMDKYVKAGIAYLIGLFWVALFVWIWWQAKSNDPVFQVEELLNKNK